MFNRLFLEHPRSVGEGCWEHQREAGGSPRHYSRPASHVSSTV